MDAPLPHTLRVPLLPISGQVHCLLSSCSFLSLPPSAKTTCPGSCIRFSFQDSTCHLFSLLQARRQRLGVEWGWAGSRLWEG